MWLLKWALISAVVTAALVLFPLMQPATDEEILCVMQGHCQKGLNK